AAMPATTCPVPSGEPSSTTSTSMRESWSRISGTMRVTLSRSLYVGTMTRTCRIGGRCSGNSSSLHDDTTGQGDQRDDDGDPGNGLPRFVRRTGKGEFDLPCSGRQLHPYHAVLRSAYVPGLAVDRRMPAWIVILGDYQRGARRRPTVECQRHPARRIRIDVRHDAGRRGQ